MHKGIIILSSNVIMDYVLQICRVISSDPYDANISFLLSITNSQNLLTIFCKDEKYFKFANKYGQ